MVVLNKDRIPCCTCSDGSLILPSPSPTHDSARQHPHLQSRVTVATLSAQSVGVRMKLDRNGRAFVNGRLSGEKHLLSSHMS